LVGAFKTVSTKRINQMRGTPGAMVWQRNYHEHIIRDEKSLNNIRRYIRANPLMWMYDVENPNRMECLTEQTGRALARHYGFTDEELDFIINYDIKHRMGREDQEGAVFAPMLPLVVRPMWGTRTSAPARARRPSPAVSCRSSCPSGSSSTRTSTLQTRLRVLKAASYQIHLAYLWLASPELAVARVRERVRRGGHSVPEATIRRRYFSGLRNLFNVFMSLVDDWIVYDNSSISPVEVASCKHRQTHIWNPRTFEVIKRWAER